ncbi:MAG: siphovirus Gp157 family protein [Bacteroidota bacterium]
MYKPLYEIQAEYAAIIAQLEDLDGELTEEIEFALTINKEELEKKAEAYALRIMDFAGQSDNIKAEIDRLSKRKKMIDSVGEKLKGMIDSAMKQFGVDKISTDKITLSFRKSQAIEVPVDFEDSILRFVSIEAKIDPAKVQQAIDEAKGANAPAPEVPTEEMLGYFKLSAEINKTKIKDALKDGKTIGEVLLLDKKNLQIK